MHPRGRSTWRCCCQARRRWSGKSRMSRSGAPARKVQRRPPVQSFYEAGVWLHASAPARGGPHAVYGDRARARPAQGRRPREDGSPRRAETGRAAARRLLTAVRPPTPAEEAARDLAARGRTCARICCGPGIVWASCSCGAGWCGTRPTGRSSQPVARSLTFEHAADQAVLSDYRLAIEQLEARLETVNSALGSWRRGALSPAGPVAAVLPGHRHPDGDHARGRAPRCAPLHVGAALMAYVGLVPASTRVARRGGGVGSPTGMRSSGACWSKPPGTINIARPSAHAPHGARANPRA